MAMAEIRLTSKGVSQIKVQNATFVLSRADRCNAKQGFLHTKPQLFNLAE